MRKGVKTTFWEKVGPKTTFWEKVGPKNNLLKKGSSEADWAKNTEYVRFII